ncbi:MAG: UDP-N-acetylmuramoyl-L-alanine--D-glutamate ligase [Parcubacteria group bacterium]|jgi:UDP-N-acetylmuramoylalanine--D-glutamate ligase
MQSKPAIFKFTSYKFNPLKRRIFFNYEIDFKNADSLNFTEEIILPRIPDLKKIPKELLENIFSDLHLMLGISYYKLYCPPKIVLRKKISKEQADFWDSVYANGLGEFFYRNNINPEIFSGFPFDKKMKRSSFSLARNRKSLVGIGGGKDSIAVGELLKKQKKEITAFVVETQEKSKIVSDVIGEMKVPRLEIKRIVDKKIFEKHPGSYNGHIPISAVIAFLGVLSAIFYDYKNIIVGNEHSSNFGNVEYKGMKINHQWSKSLEFEKLFQKYLENFITPDVNYFSLLRPFFEIRIAQLFSRHKNYFKIFSSCNRNFRIFKEKSDALWCNECPKCVFAFVMLSAFLSKKELIGIFGKNLYDNEKLLPVFEDILGLGKMKPFDCVGTFEESQVAFFLASKKFSQSAINKKLLPKIKVDEELLNKVFRTNLSLTPENFKFLGMKNAAILGYGREGKVTEKYLKKNYPDLKVSILDQKNDPEYLTKLENFDIAVKTPGINKALINIPYTTATNIFFSEVENKIIGVTGSKGKSTTASLIYEILKAGGKKVRLLGNIGNPMLEVLLKPIGKDEIFVLELSSYQLDDIKYSPNIAVVTNLFPEHMNYHGSVEKYYQAKKNIINFQRSNDIFVYNPKDKLLADWAKETKSKKIVFAQKLPLNKFDVPLLGEHNLENIKAAVTVAKVFNISDKTINQAIKNFKPLPHRIEFVGKFKEIKFYDDAISTTPESTIAAIKSLKNIGVIFLGGEDRGYDFSELEKAIRKNKIKNIVLFPDSGKIIFKSEKDLNILKTSSMEKAVKFAFNNIKAGEIVLLSCASPSYSLWKNFEEKGDLFKKYVKILGK